MHFCFITTFTPLGKDEKRKKEKKKKNQETKPILKVHISETPCAI